MLRTLPIYILLWTFAPLSLHAGEKQLKLFDQVWKQIHDEYYDSTFHGIDWDHVRSKYRGDAERAANDREIYPVLERMVDELKDAHTRVISPADVREDRTHNRNAFGFSVRLVEGEYIVNQVEPRSAMEFAGVQRGWVLNGVDGKTAPSNNLHELAVWYAKSAIRDKCMALSTVKFDFLDAQNLKHPVAAKCTVVNVPPRQEALRLAGGVLYVRMDAFQSSTGAWFEQVMESNHTAPGLVLDLRLNPGGFKSQLLKCLDALYAKPVSAGVDISRKGKEHTWKVHGRGSRAFANPVVVLIDEMSMSSSEILAAAIEETGRGRVIGRKSPGKVLLSYETPLGGGGKLQLAIRDYRTERGRRLEGAGVVPDEVVTLSAADMRKRIDRDLERALAIIMKK
ncbi:MAG TPA: S41 family peptidase [Bryobacteraceae bacterium]|jgi:carboxyl-terminal processing protease